MYTPKRIRSWARLLLAGGFFWSGVLAVAQDTQSNANASHKSAHVQIVRRQAAKDELAAAVAARVRSNPDFKRFIEAVNNHKTAVAAFVEAKKGGKE